MMFSDQEEENFNLSLSKFESMLKSNKVLFFDSEEFENIVLHYLDTGKLNLSKKALKLGLEQHPDSIGLMLVKVELLVFENKFDEGFEMVRRLKKLDPNNEEVYIQEANLYSKKGLHPQAIKSLDIALTHTDNEADVFSLMAMEYLYMDELSSAKHFFAKCLKIDPDDQSSLYNVVHCYDFLNQPQEAIHFLENFIDENPYNEVAWHQLGKQFIEVQNYKKAIQAFDFAYVIDTDFVGALVEKAKVFEKIKSYEKAIAIYRESLEIDDESAFVHWRIGRCYERLEKYTDASNSYQMSLKHDVLFEKSWLAVIDLHLKIEDLEKAKIFTEAAIELDDENPLYWQRLRDVSVCLKDWLRINQASKMLISFGELQLKNWLIWADAAIDAGDPVFAIDLLLRAEEYHPNRYEIDYRLAGLYFSSLQHNEKAVYRLQSAMINRFDKVSLFQKMFPMLWSNPNVQKYITDYKNRLHD